MRLLKNPQQITTKRIKLSLLTLIFHSSILKAIQIWGRNLKTHQEFLMKFGSNIKRDLWTFKEPLNFAKIQISLIESSSASK